MDSSADSTGTKTVDGARDSTENEKTPEATSQPIASKGEVLHKLDLGGDSNPKEQVQQRWRAS